MSWPKAFVNYKGTTRKATVWGVNRKSARNVDGVCVSKVELAIEIYYPDGKTELSEPPYKSFIITFDDVKSINWECHEMLKRTIGVDMIPENLQVHFDGFGADVKAQLYNDEKVTR